MQDREAYRTRQDFEKKPVGIPNEQEIVFVSHISLDVILRA